MIADFLFLFSIAPPKISPETTTLVETDQNQNSSLTCYATGVPQPNITWVRLDGKPLPTGFAQYRVGHLSFYSFPSFFRFRNRVHKETSSYFLLGAQDQRLGAEQDQLPCGSTGTSSGSYQETETCMVRACHTPRQPPQNHPSRHLGG